MNFIRQLPLFGFLYLIGLLVTGCVGRIPNTGPELKVWLEQPGLLLWVMYLGAIASMLKTISTARRDGAQITLRQYLGHWPETVAAILAVPIAWAGLLMTDQLNFAAAAAFGAISNTTADALRSGGRSAALAVRSPIVVGLLAMMLACTLTGCVGLQTAPNASSLVVQYATAKVIEQGRSPEARLERAKRIRTIVGEAKEWLNGEGVSIGLLEAAARERIAKLNLAPSDTILANALVQTAVDDLRAKIGEGVIPKDKLVTVNQLLGWIETAAELYGA